MHVLIVTPWFFEPPRKKMGLVELAKNLSKKTKVSVIVPQVEGAASFEQMGELSIYRFKPWFYVPSLPYTVDLLLWSKIIKFCRKERVDIVIAVTTQFLTTFMTAISVNFTKLPMVTWIHGSSLTSGRGWVDKLANIYDRTAATYAIKKSTKVFCLAPFLMERAKQLGAKDNIVIVPNGVDTSVFRRTEKNVLLQEELQLGDNKVVTFVGRLFPIKGVEYLLDASREILKEYPNTIFVIYGDGPLVDDLKKIANDIDESRFRFLGFRKDVVDILNLTDVFVLPSLSEGLSQAILEAFACGVPVVASAVGGTPDLVKENENGYLVPPKNTTKLRQSIIRLLEDVGLNQQIRTNNRCIAEEEYDVRVVAKFVIDCLESAYK